MSTKDRLLSLTVCAAFGLVGGAVSNLFLGIRHVTAEVDSVVRARGFEVVDQSGHVSAEFGRDGAALLTMYNSSSGKVGILINQKRLSISDDSGNERLILGMIGDLEANRWMPELIIRDTKGKNIYEVK